MVQLIRIFAHFFTIKFNNFKTAFFVAIKEFVLFLYLTRLQNSKSAACLPYQLPPCTSQGLADKTHKLSSFFSSIHLHPSPPPPSFIRTVPHHRFWTSTTAHSSLTWAWGISAGLAANGIVAASTHHYYNYNVDDDVLVQRQSLVCAVVVVACVSARIFRKS